MRDAALSSAAAAAARRLFLPRVKWFLNELLATRRKGEEKKEVKVGGREGGARRSRGRSSPEGRGRAGKAWPCPPSAEDRDPGRCRSIPHRLGSASEEGGGEHSLVM